ncbi:MAG: hypothetical protein QM765_32025 [Myxococcales bacterium]
MSVGVEGPKDMPEWGDVLRDELAQALSVRGVIVDEPGPGVLHVKVAVDAWDYDERSSVPVRGNGIRALELPMLRQCTAHMVVNVEIDGITGDAVAQRKYMGVESDWLNELSHLQLYNRFQTPSWFMRQAAKRVVAQLAGDLRPGWSPPAPSEPLDGPVSAAPAGAP